MCISCFAILLKSPFIDSKSYFTAPYCGGQGVCLSNFVTPYKYKSPLSDKVLNVALLPTTGSFLHLACRHGRFFVPRYL